MRRELPLLLAITLLVGGLLWDGSLGRVEATGLLGGFFILVGWTIYEGLRYREDALAGEMDQELATLPMPLDRALFWPVAGPLLLHASWSGVRSASPSHLASAISSSA